MSTHNPYAPFAAIPPTPQELEEMAKQPRVSRAAPPPQPLYRAEELSPCMCEVVLREVTKIDEKLDRILAMLS